MSLKTDNLAIMFTDIVGYTAGTSQRSRAEQADWQARHERLLQPIFKAFGGRVIKTIGDAFLVTFRSPTDAVLCGTAIQDVLAQYNASAVQSDQIRVRVVVNMGEVRIDRGDIFGEAVNIAARLESLADAGDVVFSEAVYLAMNRSEVPSEPIGEHQLKGLPEPLRVHQVPRHQQRQLVAIDQASTPEAQTTTDADPLGPVFPYGGLALSRLSAAGLSPNGLLQAGLGERAGQKVSQTLRSVGEGLGEVTDRVLNSSPHNNQTAGAGRWIKVAGGAVIAVALLFVTTQFFLSSSAGIDSLIKAVDAQDWVKAKAQLAALTSISPPDPALILAGQGYLASAQGHSDQALRAYQQAFSQAPRLCRDLALMRDVAAYLDDFQANAVAVFSNCPDDSAWSAVSSIVDDNQVSEAGRIAAARLLINHRRGDRKKILTLARQVILGSGSCQLRKLAVYLLGQLGDKQDLESLRALDARQAQADNPLAALAKQVTTAAANACMGEAPSQAIARITERHR